MVFYSKSNNNYFIDIQAWNIKLKVLGIRYIQTYALKETQRFEFGFEFYRFLSIWVLVFCKSLANFEKDSLKENKKIIF